MEVSNNAFTELGGYLPILKRCFEKQSRTILGNRKWVTIVFLKAVDSLCLMYSN